MFKSLIFFARMALCWLLYFAFDRALFLLIFKEKTVNIPLEEMAKTFYYGLRLDLSMTAYVLSIPMLFYFSKWFIPGQTFNYQRFKKYHFTLLFLFSLLSIINFNVYREWGAKVNVRAFDYLLRSPNEALASSASSPLGFSFLIFSALVICGWCLQRWLLRAPQPEPDKQAGRFVYRIAFAILVLGFNFLLIRGGTGVSPNNQSMAYFSKHPFLNQAAVNTHWNLSSSFLASKNSHKNPYERMPFSTAANIVDTLYQVKNDSTLQILKTDRPNIVLILLESFTAQLTSRLGQEQGITPHFDQLMEDGFLFSSIYAAGNRTDKGLVGTLSGHPTLGTGSIVKWPEKMEKLPAISTDLKTKGYSTSFYYGGESEFDNYKAFILGHHYDQLIDKNHFQQKDMNSKWGVYDGMVFQRQLEDLRQSPQPFFSTLLTLTNHEPFELPSKHRFGKADLVQKFKSTAYYTDSCIHSYLQQAKKESWYAQTLFVFIADHGHVYPKNKYEVYMPERYHIPLLFYGEVIKEEFRGKSWDLTGSQQDLAATLLSQLGLPSKHFKWSKNLLNPSAQSFAFFTWDDGFGFLNKEHCVTFDNQGKQLLYNSQPTQTNETNRLLQIGKAYLQEVYQQFINL